MHSNSAFAMVTIVGRHFGNETVMVFHNLAIDDDFVDGVEVASDAAVHGDMGADVVLWVVGFQFLHTGKNHNFQFYIMYNVEWKLKCFMCCRG